MDFDATFEGGIFPKHIESNSDPDVARWIADGPDRWFGIADAAGLDFTGSANGIPGAAAMRKVIRHGAIDPSRGSVIDDMCETAWTVVPPTRSARLCPRKTPI